MKKSEFNLSELLSRCENMLEEIDGLRAEAADRDWTLPVDPADVERVNVLFREVRTMQDAFITFLANGRATSCESIS